MWYWNVDDMVRLHFQLKWHSRLEFRALKAKANKCNSLKCWYVFILSFVRHTHKRFSVCLPTKSNMKVIYKKRKEGGGWVCRRNSEFLIKKKKLFHLIKKVNVVRWSLPPFVRIFNLLPHKWTISLFTYCLKNWII